MNYIKMSLLTVRRMMAMLTLGFITLGAHASIWYVDAINGDDSYDGSSPVFVSGIAGPLQTINLAIANSSPEDTIQVAAGSYYEQLLIDRPLTIWGANRGKGGSASNRSTESILYPDAIDLSSTVGPNNFVVTINNDDVVFDGFEVNGDNPNLISGNTVNGADVDILGGFLINGAFNGVSIFSNRLINIERFGVYGDGGITGSASGCHIGNNYFGNFNSGSQVAFLRNDIAATVGRNVSRVVSNGVQFNGYDASTSNRCFVTNNDFQVTQNGVTFLNFSNDPGLAQVTGNTITNVSTSPAFTGVSYKTFTDNSQVWMNGNTISGFVTAVDFAEYAGKSIWMWGDSLLDCTNGLVWTESVSSSGFRDSIKCDDVVILGNSDVGITINADVDPFDLVMKNSEIANSATGIKATGNAFIVPGNLSFSGMSSSYISMARSSSGNKPTQKVDATNCTFDGLLGSAMTDAQASATEDMILHYLDDNDFAWIEYKQNHAFVTGNSGNDSIQPAVDILAPGGTAVIDGLSTDENVSVSQSMTMKATAQTMFDGLEMNGIAATLSLNGQVQVNKTLTLTNGFVDSWNGDLTLGELNVADPVSIDQGSASSYVNGPMRIVNITSSSDTLYFPIGATGDFRPIQMVITHGTANELSSYQARLVNMTPAANTIASTLTHISAVRYWSVLQTGSPSVTNVEYTVRYGLLSNDDEVSDPTNLRVTALRSSVWEDLGGVGIAVGNGQITSSNPFTSFGEVTLANARGGSNALGKRGPSADFSFNGVCEVDSFRFTDGSVEGGDPITSWFWDFGEAARSDDTSSYKDPKWLYSAAGAYTVKLIVTSSTGESDSINYDVRVAGSPAAGFTADIPCSPEPITMMDTTAALISSWEWYNNGVLFGNANLENLIPPVGSHTIKLVVETDDGCKDSVERDIYYGDSIRLTFSPGINITKCDIDPVTITVNGVAQSFLWNTGDTTQSIIAQAEGVYSVVARNSNSCWASDSVRVINSPSPTADAGPDHEITLGETVILGGNSTSGVNYLWSPSNGLNDNQSMNPQANPSTSQSYVLRVYNDFGCDDYDTVRVIVNKPTVIVVPNLISPNGDGANDTWDLSSLPAIDNAIITVYSRWGKEVFRSDGYQHDWGGTYEGEPLPEGTYVYVIEFLQDGLDIVKGNLQIIR